MRPIHTSCWSTTRTHNSGCLRVGMWNLVSIRDTVARELLEELGFPTTQAMRFDTAEFSAVQWFALADIPLARSDPHMVRFIAKLRTDAPRVVG